MGRRHPLRAAAIAAAALAPVALAQAAFEPRSIHVGHQSQVFVAKRSGGAHRLTGGPAQHSLPAWSRSGSRLSATAGGWVQIMTRDGAVRGSIRGGPAFTDRVAWSRDDERAAFVAYGGHRFEDFDGRLVVANRDGAHRRVLAHPADHRPDWSPDGRTLYYLGGRFGSYKATSLYAVPARGGKRRRLASNVDAHSRVLVSPDGKWILFRREADLWLVRTSGGGERRVVRNDSNHVPRSYGWLADGSVFGGKSHRHPLVSSLSGGRRVLGARFPSAEYDVAPNGRWVAWADPDGIETAIRAARADGTGERVVARFDATNNPVDLDTLAWSPDGRRVLVEPYRHVGD